MPLERSASDRVPSASTAGNDPTENHFTGKERDTESGNDYMFARYYNSATGRFLSPDWSAKEDPVPYAKLDDPQSLNLYSYVLNNPVGRADPNGHVAPRVTCNSGVDACQKALDKDLTATEGMVEGGMTIAATAIAGPGGPPAVDSIGLGLLYGARVLTAVGGYVIGTTQVIGAAAGAETHEATDTLGAMTDPKKAAAAVITHSVEKGSQLADAVTVGHAIANAASGRKVENPIEVLGSASGAVSFIKDKVDAIKAVAKTPSRPPAPAAPGRAPCSVAGACQ